MGGPSLVSPARLVIICDPTHSSRRIPADRRPELCISSPLRANYAPRPVSSGCPVLDMAYTGQQRSPSGFGGNVISGVSPCPKDKRLAGRLPLTDPPTVFGAPTTPHRANTKSPPICARGRFACEEGETDLFAPYRSTLPAAEVGFKGPCCQCQS